MTTQNWKWFGHAGHFICGNRCRFHLCTKVGKYLVSTVGELVLKPTEDSTRFEDVGYNRKYETMVFRTKGVCRTPGCKCGLPTIVPSELDFAGYNTAGDATKGHMWLCQKWSAK